MSTDITICKKKIKIAISNYYVHFHTEMYEKDYNFLGKYK